MINLIAKNAWKEHFFNSALLTDKSMFTQVFERGTYRYVRDQIDNETERSREKE